MKNKKRIASWGARLSINFFALVLTILFFWFLGFILKDLRTLPGPDYHNSTVSFFDPKLRSESDELRLEISALRGSIIKKEHQQKFLREGSSDLENTLDRLKESGAEDDIKAKELAASAWQQLLERRQRIMTLGNEMVDANAELDQLELRMNDLDAKLSVQERSAQAHYSNLYNRHRLLTAFYQLGVLAPFFLASVFFLLRRRESPYFPVYLALGLATFIQIGLVMFEYFPREYFKYILIGFLIVAILWLLICTIRSVAKPTVDRVMKQNRESYERFLCTTCEYPIRTGPRTFLFWTRRTVHKVMPKGETVKEEIYYCPHCGTSLYETCPSCGKIRHSQLEFCQHCGNKKQTEVTEA